MWKKIEKTLGGLKFAVIIITLFTLTMIVGTFVESYQGTEFAGRLIYKSTPFMLLQLAMFLCIYCAATLRLPPKKRLFGFYTIHSGLLIIFLGSFITWHAGVDGSITLYPNSPNNKIALKNDLLKMTFQESGKVVTFELPSNAFPTTLNESYQSIKLKKYLPYSEAKLHWVRAKTDLPSSSYLISNANVSQQFTLSLNPRGEPDYSANISMGPLNVYYLFPSLSSCFAKNNPSGFFFWNSEENTCFTPEERNIPINEVTSKKKFIVIQGDTKENKTGRPQVFFPTVSPWPLSPDFKSIQQSGLRVFNKNAWNKSPALFLFGKKMAYFQNGKWIAKTIKKGQPMPLPWMKFNLSLLRHETKLFPQKIPYSVTPIQKDNVLIKGRQKAVLIEVNGDDFWVTGQKRTSLVLKSPAGTKDQKKGQKVTFEVIKKTITLPFEFTLTRFQMNKDPGTNNPASYESFVNLFTQKGNSSHHIFMNNPLKYRGFTFYQASYFPLDDNKQNFGSVLSANVDSGRPIKYFGSLLLVCGAIWHYRLNKKKHKPLKQTTICSNKKVT